MGFHRCQRWWRAGFADCPYEPLEAHEETDDDDDEEDKDIPPAPVKVPAPPVTPEDNQEIEEEDEETNKFFVPEQRTKGTNSKITKAVAEAVAEQVEEIVANVPSLVPADYFGLLCASCGVTVPAGTLAPVLQAADAILYPVTPPPPGGWNFAKAPTPAAVIEATMSMAIGAAAAQQAGKSLGNLPTPAPVLATALQGVSMAATALVPQDFFGNRGPLNAAVKAPIESTGLSPLEVMMVGAAIGFVVAPIAVGGAGFFFNWASELEQLMGTY